MGDQDFNPMSIDAMLAKILAEQVRANEAQERTNKALEAFIEQHEATKARVTKIEMAHQRVLGMTAAIAALVSVLGSKLWNLLSGGS